MSTLGRTMTSRFPGTCVCGQRFETDAMIRYQQGARPPVQACPACDANLRPVEEVRCRVTVTRVLAKKEAWGAANGRLDVNFADSTGFNDAPVAFTGDQTVKFSGTLGDLHENDVVELRGRWAHGKYGWELKVSLCLPLVAHSEQALRAFLERMPQVGPTRARDIVALFSSKEECIRAIENTPLLLTEVSGITKERALDIQQRFLEEGELRDAALFLAELQLPAPVQAWFLDTFGGDAKAVLSEDPYRLMLADSMGFKRTDQIALAQFKLETNDVRRHAALVFDVIKNEENGFDGGHTYVDLQ